MNFRDAEKIIGSKTTLAEEKILGIFITFYSANTIGDMARATPRIYVTLEDQQADHQSTMVKVKGKIVEQSISIMVDLISTNTYITLKIVENWVL